MAVSVAPGTRNKAKTQSFPWFMVAWSAALAVFSFFVQQTLGWMMAIIVSLPSYVAAGVLLLSAIIIFIYRKTRA